MDMSYCLITPLQLSNCYYCKLKEDKIWVVDTLKTRSMRTCQLEYKKELQKEGKGSHDGATSLNSGCSIMLWFDNKPVKLALNSKFVNKMDLTQSWRTKIERQKRTICLTLPSHCNIRSTKVIDCMSEYFIKFWLYQP